MATHAVRGGGKTDGLQMKDCCRPWNLTTRKRATMLGPPDVALVPQSAPPTISSRAGLTPLPTLDCKSIAGPIGATT